MVPNLIKIILPDDSKDMILEVQIVRKIQPLGVNGKIRMKTISVGRIAELLIKIFDF